MRKTNPIVVRSRASLVAAAVQLLAEKQAADISITDVVVTAGMSRPTFYQHFADLAELLATVGVEKLVDIFHKNENFPQIVELIKAEASLFHQIHSSAGGAYFHATAIEVTTAWLGEKWGEEPDPELWSFIAAGAVWLIFKHLAEYCDNPTDMDFDPTATFTHILQEYF